MQNVAKMVQLYLVHLSQFIAQKTKQCLFYPLHLARAGSLLPFLREKTTKLLNFLFKMFRSLSGHYRYLLYNSWRFLPTILPCSGRYSGHRVHKSVQIYIAIWYISTLRDSTITLHLSSWLEDMVSKTERYCLRRLCFEMTCQVTKTRCQLSWRRGRWAPYQSCMLFSSTQS
jgi:hypothetical protein